MVHKKVVIDRADRMYQLPPELISFLPERPRPSLIKKTDIVDLAGFRWPVSESTDGKVDSSALLPASTELIEQLKEELANWYHQQWRVKLNPEKEVFIGPGVTSLTFSLAQAFVDHGDIVFVPEIGYPVYRRATIAAGGEPVMYGVSGKNDWMPNFDRVSTRLGRVARILFLNSPHNPTGAELGEKEMNDLVWLAGRENILVINDAAYQSVSGRRPVSLMAAEGAKKIGAEVGSFSYIFGLPRLPLGYVVGNREIITGLQQAARLTPGYLPAFHVERTIAAIKRYPNDELKALRKHFAASRSEAVKLIDLLELENCGLDSVPFIWARIERRRQATAVASQMYRRGRILVVTGIAFGESGEGYLRFSLAAPAESYATALERVKRKPRLFVLPKEE